MNDKTEEQLTEMYKTEKIISVKTNELDYDTIQGLLNHLDTTEEEFLTRCFQVGLYTLAQEFMANGGNDQFIKDIAKVLDGEDSQ